MSWADSLVEDELYSPDPSPVESDRVESVTQTESKEGGFQTRGGYRGNDGGRRDSRGRDDRGYNRDDRDHHGSHHRGGRDPHDRDGGYSNRDGGFRSRGGDDNRFDDRRGRGGYSRGGFRDRPREPYVQKPIPDDPPFKIYVKNLAWSLGAQDVGRYFEDVVGSEKVVSCDVPKTEEGRSKGVAIVEFTDRDALVEALKTNGNTLREREIIVNVELPRKQYDSPYPRGGPYRTPREITASQPKETPSAEAQPSQRPRVTLDPRTSLEPVNQPAVLTKSDPFGGAKPVDTAKIENEKFEKFKQKIAQQEIKEVGKADESKEEPKSSEESGAPSDKPVASESSPSSSSPSSSSSSESTPSSSAPWRPKNRGEPPSDAHFPSERRGRGGRGGDHFGGRWSGRGGHDSRRGDHHRHSDERRRGGDDRRRAGDDRRHGDFKPRGGSQPKPSSVNSSSYSTESKQSSSESVNKFAALSEDNA